MTPRSSTLTSCFVWLGLAGSCRPQAPQDRAPGQPTAPLASSPAKSQPAASTSAPDERKPPLLPEGCFAEARLDTDPATLLAEVTRDCRLDSNPIEPEPKKLELEEGDSTQVPLLLASPACMRWVAAGAKTLIELELTLLDSSATPLASDQLKGNLAILAENGPVCAPAGQHTLSVRAREGSGSVWVQGYATKPLAPEASPAH